MPRERISTTVDADRLALARRRTELSDSELVDRALAALLRDLDASRERQALRDHPYEEDAEVSWTSPAGPPLPYDGEIPDDVVELASERRATYGA